MRSSSASPSKLNGLTVLLTVGPTREPLDPVRFLTNSSSGKMGWALAAEARRRGAVVLAVAGPTPDEPPDRVLLTWVETALEMRREVLRRVQAADVVIAAAAVSDWRFSKVGARKLKSGGAMTVKLVPNPDIAAELGAMRRKGKLKAQALVGFALETHKVLDHAFAKLRKKGLDMIVANTTLTLAASDIRFSLVGKDGTAREFPPMDKDKAARKILDAVEALLP